MIHIIHTPAATLARRRMLQVARCSLGVAAFAFCVAVLASQVSILQPAAPGCDFTGVPFYPVEMVPSLKKVRHSLTPAFVSTPDLPPLPHVPPQALSPTGELAILDELEPEAAPALETDVAVLLQPVPAPAPARAKMAATEKMESYTPPDYLSSPSPPYPPRLKQRRLQGCVGVLIHVSSAGQPTEVQITNSSGNRQLDCHTRSWIMQHWRFRPAFQGSTPVAAQVRTSITFSLHS